MWRIFLLGMICGAIGTVIGYFIRSAKAWFWDRPIEGVYWKRGLPNIAPGSFPPMPKVKKPKSNTTVMNDALLEDMLNREKRIKGFCGKFVAAAKRADTEGRVKITELVGEAEKILNEIKEAKEPIPPSCEDIAESDVSSD